MARRNRHVRSGDERAAHWLLAASVLALIFSGIEIYRAAPFLSATLSKWPTLGVDLTSALLWHFAAAWGLLFSLAILLVRRLRGSGIALWPIPLHLDLSHSDEAYNPLQKVAYIGVFVLLAVAILSGLVLWKPVQLQAIGSPIGGYEPARRVHFFAMAGLGLFAVGHVVMALLVPRTIAGMLLGLKTEGPSDVET